MAASAAEPGQEGLRKIEAGLHDVYLIDYRLGPDDGLQLLREAVGAGFQAPIIMITGQGDQDSDVAAMRAGAASYLVKGRVDAQLLDRTIRYALERGRLLKEIRELATRDPTTGLYNRRELRRFLDYELERSRRYGHSLALVMIDVDHFRDINDRFGHQAGDEALRHIAQVLLSGARTCDLLARYGGDEFAIVMTETTAEEARRGAERLRKAAGAGPAEVNSQEGPSGTVHVTISAGVAAYPGDADSSEALIEAADQVLYQAKRGGRNRVVGSHAEPTG
ncbi:MAG: GGDEF domain-containing protein [Thermoleophilia bacterium]